MINVIKDYVLGVIVLVISIFSYYSFKKKNN